MNFTTILRNNVFLILICAGFAVFGFLRLNDTSLYTDSTRYVIWGTSFSHAEGFVDKTQPDPERYVVNAPLYSVLLSPVLLFFPFSLLAAKFWTLLIGICAIVLFYLWLERRFGKLSALIGTVVIASNPLMLVMATEAMSEMAFIALVILAMILIESRNDGKQSLLNGLSLALLMVLSFLPLLREVSVALVGAIVIVLLVEKQYKYAAWIAGATALVVGAWMIRNIVLVGIPQTSQSANVNFVFGHFVTSAETPLAVELFQRILVNVRSFYVFSISLLAYPFPQPLIVDPDPLFRAFFKSVSVAKYILPFVVLPLVVAGMVQDRKRGPRAFVGSLFVIFYLFIIILYPVQDARFLLPLLPFAIYYVIGAVRNLGRFGIFKSKRLRISLVVVAGGLIVLPNLDCQFEVIRTNWQYNHSPEQLYSTIRKTNAAKELFVHPWQPFGEWIRQNLPDSTVIAGTFKELAIFIGNRKILEVNYGVPVPMFERFLRDYGVEYVVSAGENENTRPYEFAMKESRRYWFEPVHSLLGLRLFKVHSAFLEQPPARPTRIAYISDTTGSGELLERGREMILRGDYQRALNDLSIAGNTGSNPALVAFQMTIAYAMSYRESDAARSLQQLYSMPQSTSYIPAARLHLQAMETYRNAMKTPDLYQSSAQLFDVAAFYWNFGYYQQAYSLVRSLLQKDTAYFVGLLWGWDYATQLGDEQQAASYLKILELIEGTNPVVRGYQRITALKDTLRRAKDPRERSRLRLATASVYWDIGLFDEAFDHAYHSIGEDPTNKAAYRYLIDLFRTTNKPWGVRKMDLAMIGKS